MKRCLETRATTEGFKRRRYTDGVDRWSTIEVPLEMWTVLNRPGRATPAVRLRTLAREQQVACARALHKDGWKPEAIAHHMSLPLRTIHRWVRTP